MIHRYMNRYISEQQKRNILWIVTVINHIGQMTAYVAVYTVAKQQLLNLHKNIKFQLVVNSTSPYEFCYEF